jgi:hypothetical protein
MAERVLVDAERLHSAAADSMAIAHLLAHSTKLDGGVAANQPSYSGSAAVTSAIARVRDRQAARVEAQAHDMTTAASLYDNADTESAGNLAQTV